MKEKFSVAEIKKLMRECKKSRSFLKIGDLIIDCREQGQSQTEPVPKAIGSSKKAKDIEEKGQLQDQHDTASEIMSTLHVQDPAAYEQMLLRNELGEDKNH